MPAKKRRSKAADQSRDQAAAGELPAEPVEPQDELEKLAAAAAEQTGKLLDNPVGHVPSSWTGLGVSIVAILWIHNC